MTCTLAKAFILSTLSFSIASSAYAAAETYTLDPSHTNIIWQINHFGFSNPSGKMTKTEGTVTLDEKHPENSKVTATISTNDILTGIPKLDEHLKTADFFDSAKFPIATFASDKVELSGKDTAKVHGNLTLHGVTKPITLEVKLNKVGINMMNKKTAGFSASTTLKRSDFGIMKYLPALGDEVPVSIEAEANILK